MYVKDQEPFYRKGIFLSFAGTYYFSGDEDLEEARTNDPMLHKILILSNYLKVMSSNSKVTKVEFRGPVYIAIYDDQNIIWDGIGTGTFECITRAKYVLEEFSGKLVPKLEMDRYKM